MRESKICAVEKLLLVKVLFEEVNFKTSFEVSEGRAVMESESERIKNLCSRETVTG